MINQSSDDRICALSKASFSNLVVAMNRISALATEVAKMLAGAGCSFQRCAEDIKVVATAAGNGVVLLAQSFEVDLDGNSHRSDEGAEQDSTRILRELIFGLSNGATLVSLLEVDSDDPELAAKLAPNLQSLAMYGVVLRTLFDGLICYRLAEEGTQDCQRTNCLVRKKTLSALAQGSPRRDVLWGC